MRELWKSRAFIDWGKFLTSKRPLIKAKRVTSATSVGKRYCKM